MAERQTGIKPQLLRKENLEYIVQRSGLLSLAGPASKATKEGREGNQGGLATVNEGKRQS
jgi:hypothetical protein